MPLYPFYLLVYFQPFQPHPFVNLTFIVNMIEKKGLNVSHVALHIPFSFINTQMINLVSLCCKDKTNI